MLNNILLSQSEKHPLASENVRIDTSKKTLLVVYGLARRRGDNCVAISRYTDDVQTVLSKYALTLYQIPSDDPVQPQEPAREHLAEQGIRLDFAGIAWNIRRGADAWTAEKYETFLAELSDAFKLHQPE